MKLNNKALMTSAGIGAVLHIVLSICAQMPPFASLAVSDATVIRTIGTVATAASLCGWVINLVIGFAYVYFAAREDGSVKAGNGAIGGALSTAIAAVLGGLLAACLVLAIPFVTSQGNIDAETILTYILAGVFFAILGVIVGAIVGAIGGLIGALTIGKPKTA